MLTIRGLFGFSSKKIETPERLHDLSLPFTDPNGVKAELAVLKETGDVLKTLIADQEDTLHEALQEERQRLLRIYHSLGTELNQQDLRKFLIDVLEIQTNLAELAAVAENSRLSKTLSRESVRLNRAVKSVAGKLEQSYRS